MIPSIILAPWERTPGWQKLTAVEEPLIHTIPWYGTKIPFIFQFCGIDSRPHVFARPVESHDEGNWLVCEAKQNVYHSFWSKREHLERIVQSLCANDGQFLMARFLTVSEQFFLAESEELYWSVDPGNSIILFEDGEGYWYSNGGEVLARFGFSLEEGTLRNDVRAVVRAFDQWLSDSDSDIAFARRWNMLQGEAHDEDTQKRANLVLGGEEKQKEIESVMRWTVLCEPLLWQMGDEWAWVLDRRDLGPLMNHDQAVNLFGRNFQQKFPFVYRMQQFLLQHHIPGLCHPLWQKHRCTMEFPSLNDYLGERFAAVEIKGQPSAHERLEARLQLRDWLQQNAYPDEIEAIGSF